MTAAPLYLIIYLLNKEIKKMSNRNTDIIDDLAWSVTDDVMDLLGLDDDSYDLVMDVVARWATDQVYARG